MAGKFGGRFAAGIVLLTFVGACGYDHTSNPTGYGDTTPNATEAARAEPRVIRATGDLTQALAEFRASLGGSLNPPGPGEQATGRREINWDAISGALLNVDTFPGDFFNRVSPRGQIFTTEGTGFRVSDNALADLNPAYASQFAAFSPPKIFVAVGRRALAAHFVVAGSSTPARVNGFGVVFSDVDVDGSATLAFFDARGRLLRRVSAPVRSDAAGFSFVGVTFSSPIVARVRILSGQAAITGRNTDISAGGDADLVAMDDFISGEPHAIR
jgi:hypothetical protein